MNTDRLPSQPLLPLGQAYSSCSSSPRVGSIASSHGSHTGSQSSYTSVASSCGPKTPSPSLPLNAITGPPTTISSYDAMNPGHPEMYYPQHMSAGQPHPPQTVTSNGMGHYPHPQPTILPSGQYSNPPPYPQYGYNGGLTSPPAAPVGGGIPGAQPVLPLPGVNGQGGMGGHYPYDTTGQQPPPGAKPRVTATLWEDEGSLCFQVEARGICVARREDNHMINGTKLLNVAGMTRGRRDGILKSEKIRHVVKIGPMHLKGVWIPYERALDFANKEKITELLYPLFVHNIGALLYHPTNQNRTSQVMAAAERRKQEQGQPLRSPPAGLPSINQPQHHGMPLPSHQPSLPSNNIPRPPLDRAHTFPTPPTSASGVIGSMGNGESFNWQGQIMNGSQPPSQMAAIDPSPRSMPNTPATTPPTMHYQQGGQGYDATRPMYNAPSSQQPPYPAPNGSHDRMYAPTASSYPKNEMGPPSNRPALNTVPAEHHDTKPSNGVLPSEQGAPAQQTEEDGEHEQDGEYTHDNGAYDNNRPSYNYTAPPAVGTLPNDAAINPEMSGSPNHGPPSGRATPRTAAPPQPYYSQHNSGYGTPPRVPTQSSNVYNVISDDRAQNNGTSGNDVYAPQPDMGSSMPNGYAPQPPVLNGISAGQKRGRDDDERLPRPGGDGPGGLGFDLKRRKTMESSISAPAYDALSRPAPTAISGSGQPR